MSLAWRNLWFASLVAALFLGILLGRFVPRLRFDGFRRPPVQQEQPVSHPDLGKAGLPRLA